MMIPRPGAISLLAASRPWGWARIMRPRRVGAAAIVVSAIVALGWPGSTAAQIVEFPLPTTAALPDGIAAGPDGALWFTEFNGNKIGRITTAGVITEFPIPTSNSGP